MMSLAMLGCNKKETPSQNQTGLATYIFSPGGAETQVSYYSFEEAGQVLETKSTFYQVRETVKIGDQIKLGMQTFGNPVGNFRIQLNINNKTIKEISGDGTIYLTHTVSASDLN